MLLAVRDMRHFSHICPGGYFFIDSSSQLSLGDVLSGYSIDVSDTATRAGAHNGDAGRVVVHPHGSGVGEDVRERTTRMHMLCREIMGQNTDRAEIFGDPFMYLNVKASRRRYGAERARPDEETARKDGQRRERSTDDIMADKAEDHHRYIYTTVRVVVLYSRTTALPTFLP